MVDSTAPLLDSAKVSLGKDAAVHQRTPEKPRVSASATAVVPTAPARELNPKNPKRPTPTVNAHPKALKITPPPFSITP
jgi:hypothetical protein